MESLPNQQNEDQDMESMGPELPPEVVTGQKVDDKTKSELKASLKKRGDMSYYYAHDYGKKGFDPDAKKFYGDGLIYGGEPTLISSKSQIEIDQAQKTADSQIQTKKIAKYAWVDDDKKVKIYIDLDQFPTQITKAMIDV